MTVSVVAVITDVRRGGRPVVGFGFNSNGRYAGGILRERLLPRLARAEEEALLDEAGENPRPLAHLGRGDGGGEAGWPR
jgi:D(-)-tartrate dehydratase